MKMIELTTKQIQEFMSIYEKEYGIKITVEKAKELAMKLMLFLKVVIE